MKQLIPFKHLLLLVFILASCIIFQRCQKEDNVRTNNSQISGDTKSLKTKQNYESSFPNNLSSGCSKVIAVKGTGTGSTFYKAYSDFLAQLGGDGKAQCTATGGTCSTNSKCGFKLDEEKIYVTEQSSKGGIYTVKGTGSGVCQCVER